MLRFGFVLLILIFSFAGTLWGFEGHSLVNQEPYIPQRFDLGTALGEAASTSGYIEGEIFAGYQVFNCGFHCFAYADLVEIVAAQNGQSYYHSLAGLRFQKYFDGSSWGPYLRPFAGVSHYIFSGQINDSGLGGIAVGSRYFLHPVADARFEIAAAFNSATSWLFVTVGFVFKLRNL